MSRPLTPGGNACPLKKDHCALQCKYNHFLAGGLEIHSWELKCLDCGFRKTVAYRSDDEEADWSSGVQKTCPFCHRKDLEPGKNPCE